MRNFILIFSFCLSFASLSKNWAWSAEDPLTLDTPSSTPTPEPVASSSPASTSLSPFLNQVVEILSKNYPQARIVPNPEIKWGNGKKSWDGESIRFLGEDGHGTAHFSLISENGFFITEAWISFSAWLSVHIALKRIHPGELLDTSFFTTRDVDEATGQPHEYRGLIIPTSMSLSGYEAVQTILEGQFLLSTSIRKTPDVRRGDSIKIVLRSDDISLTLPGTALEASYLRQQIKVSTLKTRKELLGRLLPKGVVEVRL